MKNDKWELLGRLEEGGHRLFRCLESKQIAVADNSGAWPNTTDDGVLYLDLSRPATLDWHDDSVMRLRMPVRKMSDLKNRNYVIMGTWKSVCLFIEYTGLPVIRGDGIGELFEVLLRLSPKG